MREAEKWAQVAQASSVLRNYEWAALSWAIYSKSGYSNREKPYDNHALKFFNELT